MNDLSLSPSDNPHDGTPSAQGRKRKASGPSARGVASLTPEQLAKKRANDREAQRAIRERTKNTIETLERRIQDLTQQQPYQELQAIIRQKDAVQAENDEIRRRLASVMAIIQPLVGAQGLTGNASGKIEASSTDTVSELASAAQHNVQVGLGQQNIGFNQAEQYLTGQGSRSYTSQSPAMSGAPAEANNYPSPYAPAEQDQNGDNQVWHNSRSALNHQRDNLHRSHELSENGERLNFNFLLDNINAKNQMSIPAIPSRRNSPSSRSSQYPSLNHGYPDHASPQAWTTLPKNCAPTCPLDNILLNFLQARQRENASGNGSSSYISPAYPSVSSLLNPASGVTIDPLSQLMTDIISKFPNISGLPEQAATLFFMFLYMRWQIYPTQENYERLPDWLTPRPSQLFTAHPAWMDHLVWPRMRDKVVHAYQDYPFENWFLPFTSGLSVNWPYEPTDCLISTPDLEDPIINPVFERHIRRMENWSVGPQFADAFPSLADTCRIKEPPPPLHGQGNPPLPAHGTDRGNTL